MGAIVTSTRRRWVLNNYITLCTGNSISWRQDAVEKASTQQGGPSGPRLSSCSWRSGQLGIRRVGDKMRQWKPACREAGPPDPRLSSPGERERNAVIANRVRANMLQFCSVSNSLSHTTLSIKWDVYFSKRLCRSSLLCRRYDSACICIWIYNTKSSIWQVLYLLLLDGTLSAIIPIWQVLLSS